MKQPLVSIIIPTFNRADLIGETLDSIIAQTYTNWECIVVDDGSTDNTAEVLKKYTERDDRIKYHHRPAPYNAGGNGARNYGFDISKGDYINWFDSDDTMASDFLIEKINNISNNDFIICSHFTTNENLEISQIHNIANTDNILLDFITWGPNFNVLTPSILFRRLYLSKGAFRFNENLRLHQDTEFLNRVAYYCALYPGNTETAVALRGVHEENRITVADPKKTANNSHKLYDAAYKWARANNLPTHVQKFLYNKYLFFKFETLPTIERLGLYVKTALTYPGFFQSKDPYIKNIHRNLSGNRYIRRIQSIFLPAKQL